MLNTVKLFIHIFKLRKKYYYIFSQFHSIFSTVFVDKNAAALLSRKVFYSLGVFFFFWRQLIYVIFCLGTLFSSVAFIIPRAINL